MEKTNVIRVLHVIGVMDRGGAETMIMNIYREINREEFQFDFVVHTQEEGAYDREIRELGGTIYHCPRFTAINYLAYKRWWERFFAQSTTKYDIVHGHIGSTAAIYLKCARHRGICTIVHSHSTAKIVDLKSILYRIISRRVCGVAQYYFACSDEAGKARFGSKQTFEVLNNAIPTKNYSYSERIRDEVRTRYHLGESLVLGHVGRFVQAKNHKYLIDIFDKVAKKTPAKLLLVGDGELRASIEDKVKNLGLENDVIFTGIREDVSDLMQAMDVFVFPSLYEGLPLSIVEAQAAGLPCLISDMVPIECKITGLVRQIPLANGADMWAKSVIEASRIQRNDMYQSICNSGFDIEGNTRKLEKCYRSMVEGESYICL